MTAPQPAPFEKAVIIGLGLIGSSLARALRRHGLARAIVGCARSATTCERAMELGFVDAVSTDPAALVPEADLIVICSPIGTYEPIARAIGPHLAVGAIVTDVGSVKQAVIRDLGPNLPDGVHLAPAHPVAGTEHSGPRASPGCSRTAGAS